MSDLFPWIDDDSDEDLVDQTGQIQDPDGVDGISMQSHWDIDQPDCEDDDDIVAEGDPSEDAEIHPAAATLAHIIFGGKDDQSDFDDDDLDDV